MHPKEQQIAIASACGWHDIKIIGNLLCGIPKGEINKGDNYKIIPKYLDDLDAMHEAEKTLSSYSQVDYVLHLRLIAERNDDLKTVHWFHVISLEAKYRAEAFLKALNLWEE